MATTSDVWLILSCILLGDQGTNRVRHIEVQFQDLIQAFQQADNEISQLKHNLQSREVRTRASYGYPTNMRTLSIQLKANCICRK